MALWYHETKSIKRDKQRQNKVNNNAHIQKHTYTHVFYKDTCLS